MHWDPLSRLPDALGAAAGKAAKSCKGREVWTRALSSTTSVTSFADTYSSYRDKPVSEVMNWSKMPSRTGCEHRMDSNPKRENKRRWDSTVCAKLTSPLLTMVAHKSLAPWAWMENLGKYIRDLKAPVFKLRNSQKTRTAYALENTALNQIKVKKKKNACFFPQLF